MQRSQISKMDVTAIVPLSLLSAWRRGDGSDASTLHKCYTRGVWRCRSIPARVALLAGILVWWPISNIALLAASTVVNGVETRRRFGKPIWRQVAEQVAVAVRDSVPPPWYYLFELWDDARRERASLYIHRYETKHAIYRLLMVNSSGSGSALRSKAKFHEVCEQHALPVPPLVLVLKDGDVVRGKSRLPEVDLFVKPWKARGGTGAERWDWIGPNAYRSHTGEEHSEAELLARLLRRSQEKPQLVECCLENHPDIADLTAAALDTVRMLTVLNEKGEFELTHAAFRMNTKAEFPVDNYHAGGIVAPVDLRTGEMGVAQGGGTTGLPRVSEMIRYDAHPTTGATIVGRRLPLWREAVELVTQAHAAFPRLPIIGWDVGITPDGPILIEGNSAPGIDGMQVCHQQPIGDSRLAEVLAFHVRQAQNDA